MENVSADKCGHRRWCARYRIREYLANECGLTMAALADRLGISRQAVQATIRGHNHSPRVLDALRALQVPEKYLYDPRCKSKEQEK